MQKKFFDVTIDLVINIDEFYFLNMNFAYTNWIFLRALALVYFIAFISLSNQALGLWGSQGVLPIQSFLERVHEALGSWGYAYVPTVFWLSSTDAMLLAAVWLGVLCSLLALLGFAQGWMLAACFVLYLSIVATGQEFLSFQWDMLLLETGFLSLFISPWSLSLQSTIAVVPNVFIRFAFFALLFKLLFMSGLVKLLSGDPSWRDFTALTYHYLTQPLPNIVAPFAHSAPLWVHKVATFSVLLIELAVPFLIFVPQTRMIAAILFTVLMIAIMLTGNFAFFNLLTLALIVWLVPDNFWLNHLPWKLEVASTSSLNSAAIAVGTLMITLSGYWCFRFWLPTEMQNLLTPVLRVTSTFRVSSPYGLFANMTKTRPEIVIEGSVDGENWKEYEFPFKPGDPHRRPPLIAPYQPRLDWQMWFASLGSYDESPWLQNLLIQIMNNSKDVLALLEKNPFPNEPPRFLRAKLYLYEFATDNATWWKREFLSAFGPTLERHSDGATD